MSQFQFDFQDEIPGQPPTVNWYPYTEGNPMFVVTDDRTLRVTRGTNSTLWVSCWPVADDLQTVNNTEIVQRFRWSGSFSEIYVHGYMDSGDWQAASVGIFVSSAVLAADTPAGYAEQNISPLSPDTWYWLRAQLTTSSIRVKLWPDGSPEPANWQLQTNFGLTAAGAVNFGSGVFGAAEGFWLEWDYIGIGTDGDPAPMPEAEPTELGGRSSTGTLATASLDTQLSLSGRSASGARVEADVDTGVRLASRSPTAIRVNASVASRASLSGQSATPTRAQGAVRTGVILSGRSTAMPRAHAALDATVEFGGRSATATRVRGDLRVSDATRLSGRSGTTARASAVVLAPLALSGRSGTVTRAAGYLVVDMVPPIVEAGIAVITRLHAVGTAMVRRQEVLASITRVQEREARI